MGNKRINTLTTNQMKVLRKQWIKKNAPINGGYTCWLCKQFVSKDTVSLDHVMTVEEWPEYARELSNLKPSHLFCNQERAYSTLKALRRRKILRRK